MSNTEPTTAASDATPTTSAVTRDIIRVITRHPVSRAQLVLYKLVLEDANAGGDGVRSQVVKETLGFDQSAHRGMMSSLAKRVNYTRRETQQRDQLGGNLLFDQTWDGHENTYRAHSELLEAIKLLPELSAHLEQPIETILSIGQIHIPSPQWLDMSPPQAPPDTNAGSIAATEAASPEPFHQLLRQLDEQGLYCPSSLVANLLLALQTKRFVLLSGISGTGKTRIAQAIAKHYQVARRAVVAKVKDDATAITVHPYMIKYQRLILPGASGKLVCAELGQGSHRFPVEWPEGRIDAAVWVRDTAHHFFMRKELFKWFEDSFSVGSQFIAHLELNEEGTPTLLRLEPVQQTEEQQEILDNYKVVAVRPDWTDSRGLLGYYNPITEQYMSTPFLRMLLHADQERALAEREERSPHPFFLVLDEMNLARVEHYFSDFLSALESSEPMDLHDLEDVATLDEAGLAIPRKLVVPDNLFFIGTVNVDESTVMFSPKVLDRAFTIELTDVDLEGFAGRAPRSSDLDLAGWDGELSPKLCRRPERADWQSFSAHLEGALVAEILHLHTLLANEGRHFGYRVANEIARFVLLAAQQAKDPEAASWEALDLAILQKVLVKLHGTQAELERLLERLMAFALAGGSGISGPLGKIDAWVVDPIRGEWSLAKEPTSTENLEAERDDLEPGVQEAEKQTQDETARFPRSAFKLWRMRRRLHQQGFTAWVE